MPQFHFSLEDMTNEEMKNPDKKVHIRAFSAKRLYLGRRGGFTHLYMNNSPNVSSNVNSKQ